MAISKDDLLDAAFLANVAYSNSSNSLVDALVAEGWTPLGASELNLSTEYFGMGLFDSNYLFDNNNAQGFVARKGNAIVVAFAGTAGLLDVNQNLVGAITFEPYYAKFGVLLDALEDYMSSRAITKIIVTGHSLGGAAAEIHMTNRVGDSRYVGVTFGSPGNHGITNDPGSDSRLFNVGHIDLDGQGDPIFRLVPFARVQGNDIRVDLPDEDDTSLLEVIPSPHGQHSKELYASTAQSIGELLERNFQIHFPFNLEDFSYVIGTDPNKTVLVGSSGPNVIIGDEGPDLISGLDGDDILKGGAGNDTLRGATGNDILDGSSGADSMDGGAGFDFASYTTAGGGVSVFLNGGLGAGLGNDAAGDFYSSIEGAVGSNFADVLVGNDASVLGVPNTMNGGGGDDTIYGEGLDTVTGGDGNDVFFGGSGGALNLNLATSGIDTVWGSVADDILNGSTTTVPLVFIGAPGADTMSGGLGNDFLYYDNLDTVTGGAGSDWAVATLSSAGVNLNLNTTGFENTWGSPFDDVLSAAGAGGTVVIVGDVGNDKITGGNGVDFLYGFGDNDTLTGGPSGDVMLGGPGNDIYNYTTPTGSGFDSIFDFVSGSDRFQFTATSFGKAAGSVLTDGVNFIAGVTPASTNATPTWLYRTGAGILSFDQDGTAGAFAPVSLAQIFGAPTVAASDIRFVGPPVFGEI